MERIPLPILMDLAGIDIMKMAKIEGRGRKTRKET